MTFYDVHCHLDLCEPEAILHAKRKKVIIFTVGINKETNRKALQLGEDVKRIKACLGIYPTEATKMSEKEFNEELAFIEKQKDQIVAIGEIGLDLHEKGTKENFALQKKRFLKQVNLAIKLDKPIVVHSRKAEKETIELIKSAKAKKVIMHCFSGNMKLVDEIIKEGWTLSIPANCTFSHHFQEVIKRTPLNQLLGETDSPYLHPEKKFPNEPANVLATYDMITKLKGIPKANVRSQLEKNILLLCQ